MDHPDEAGSLVSASATERLCEQRVPTATKQTRFRVTTTETYPNKRRRTYAGHRTLFDFSNVDGTAVIE